MRVTIHLVNADDALALRPFVQPICAQVFASSGFAREVDGVDLDELLARARALVAERPHTRKELSDRLAERWPDVDASSLAYAFTFLEPLVHVPPRGMWGTTGPAALTTRRDVARAPARPRRSRGHRAALPARLRPRHRRRRGQVVARRRATAGARGPAPAPADVPRRAWPGALRRPRRAAARPRRPGPTALPARVRQRAPLPRRPHARDPARQPAPAAPGRQRRPHRDVPGRRLPARHVAERGRTSSASSPSRRSRSGTPGRSTTRPSACAASSPRASRRRARARARPGAPRATGAGSRPAPA